MFEKQEKLLSPLIFICVFKPLPLSPKDRQACTRAHTHMHTSTHTQLDTCARIYPRVRPASLPTRCTLLWYQHIAALNRGGKDGGWLNNLTWILFSEWKKKLCVYIKCVIIEIKRQITNCQCRILIKLLP